MGATESDTPWEVGLRYKGPLHFFCYINQIEEQNRQTSLTNQRDGLAKQTDRTAGQTRSLF